MLGIGKVIERYLRCAEVCVDAFAQTGACANSNVLRAISSYNASRQVFQILCGRQEARLATAAEGAEREACARTWVQEYLERKLFLRLELLLVTVREQAAVATATSSRRLPGRRGCPPWWAP